MGKSTTKALIPLDIAVLTVSDTRTEIDDTSGLFLQTSLQDTGHRCCDKQIVIDDIYQIRAQVSQWVADSTTQVILITGGTGFTGRDSTPEAITPLLDKSVDGFGELFRQISYTEIGTSTVQSRALAGFANDTLIFCVPGSTSACRTAWQKIIAEQLDSRHGPCNFVPHLKSSQFAACKSRE